LVLFCLPARKNERGNGYLRNEVCKRRLDKRAIKIFDVWEKYAKEHPVKKYNYR